MIQNYNNIWGKNAGGGRIRLTVKVELKSDKAEQVATHTRDFSLDYPMPLLASSNPINKSKIYPVL